MAKKKRQQETTTTADDNSEGKRQRTMADYLFEHHQDGKTPEGLGLVLNYPSEAEKVKKWLEEHAEELGYTGKIRICKKIYS